MLITGFVCALALASPGWAASDRASRDRAALAQNPAPETYRGGIRLPDFRGRDKEFSTFRTRIIQGMKEGVNFAGHLALIEIGCGAGCRFVVVGDVATGRVYNFPLGGEDNMYLNLRYAPASRTVVAYWEAEGRCLREVLTWKGGSFSRSGARDIGSDEACRSVSAAD